MENGQRRDIWFFVMIGAWAILLALLIWPLSSVLLASLRENETGDLSLANYLTIFTRPQYLTAIGNTILVGLGGMTGAVLLGVTLAFLVTRFRVRGKAVIQTLAVLALVSPPFIGAYAWIVLFGAAGLVRTFLRDFGISFPPIYGGLGVVLVFSFKFFPHVFLITSSAFASVNRSLEEAAESLGVSPTRRFFTVTLPMVLPAVSTSALLTFVLSIADFGTPRLIGRSFEVLATEAFTLYSSEVGGNPGMASAISVVLIFLSLVVVLLQRRLMRKDIYHSNMLKVQVPIKLKGLRSVAVNSAAWLIALIGALPAIIVVIFSFRRTRGPVFQPGLGLQSYERVLQGVTDPIINTLIFSAASVGAIVIVGTLIGYILARRPSGLTAVLDATLMVPYVVPGVVMGIAFIATFNHGVMPITGTALVIILAVFIRRLPYSARSVATALRQTSPRLEEAAVSLGYSPGMAFLKVVVPIIAPGILAGGMMSFVTAMNELSSSLVLYVGSTITMPVKIYLSVMDGEYGTASALSTLLLTATAVAVYAAFHLSGKKQNALL
jgi:iron(III) transport system permease protein